MSLPGPKYLGIQTAGAQCDATCVPGLLEAEEQTQNLDMRGKRSPGRGDARRQQPWPQSKKNDLRQDAMSGDRNDITRCTTAAGALVQTAPMAGCQRCSLAEGLLRSATHLER